MTGNAPLKIQEDEPRVAQARGVNSHFSMGKATNRMEAIKAAVVEDTITGGTLRMTTTMERGTTPCQPHSVNILANSSTNANASAPTLVHVNSNNSLTLTFGISPVYRRTVTIEAAALHATRASLAYADSMMDLAGSNEWTHEICHRISYEHSSTWPDRLWRNASRHSNDAMMTTRARGGVTNPIMAAAVVVTVQVDMDLAVSEMRRTRRKWLGCWVGIVLPP